MIYAGPIRIQVGDHMPRDKGRLPTPQYGVQHRVGNKRDKMRPYVVNLDSGADGAGEVESAVRDMLASVVTASGIYLDADTIKQGGEARKVYLYSKELGRLTVLHRKLDSEGKRYWGIAATYTVNSDGLRRLTGLSIGGQTPNRNDQQRIVGVAEGLAKTLLQPSRFLPQPGSLILAGDGLVVKRFVFVQYLWHSG